MPRIKVNKLILNYIDINQESENAIILLHGNSGSLKVWEHMMNNPSLASYRLVAVDLPGCGQSTHSETPTEDYTGPGQAEIIATFIRNLGISHCILAGNSLGGHISIESLPLLENIASGIFIFGTPPLVNSASMQEAFFLLPELMVLFMPEADDDALNKFIGKAFYDTEKAASMIKEDYNTTDPNVRTTLANPENKFPDEVSILTEFNKPVALIHAKEDPFINGQYIENLGFNFWKNEIQYIDKAGHYPQIEQPDKMAELLSVYAKECFD